MAVKKPAVTPIRRGRPRKVQTLAAAARSGDRRALLVALRDRIISAVSADDCPARDLAGVEV